MYISRKLNKKLEKEKVRFLKTWLLVWDILPLGTFCPWDILSLGRFVPWDVLSPGHFVPGTFCPLVRFVPWDLMSWDVLSLGTFCLGTFSLCTFFFPGHHFRQWFFLQSNPSGLLSNEFRFVFA